MKSTLIACALFAGLAGCATTPSGRSQLILMSDAQMGQMGSTAFDRMKATDKLSRDGAKQRYVQCVVGALVRELPPQYQRQAWEAQVFEDKNPNAFALPGGKVGVNTGMFAVAKDQNQLAAVIGHEIGHVIFKHANERVSQQSLAGIGQQAVGAYIGVKASSQTTQLVMAALGAGAQIGVLLPYSREHEIEADEFGQQLMARAGFDPQAAVALWQNMVAAAGSGRAPELLSTHPDPQSRIGALQQRAPSLAPQYQAARTTGKMPRCD